MVTMISKRGCRYPNAMNEIHLCACGCGGQIPFRLSYRTKGYPKWLKGHNPTCGYRYPDAENQVVYCACGCGEQIAFKPHYRTRGYPRYLWGHNAKMNSQRYPNAENEIHLCACGCGGQIPFRSTYRYYGYPKYLFNHHAPTRGIYRYPDAEEWIVYCKCGCGQRIPFRPSYRSYGYPRYLPKHNPPNYRGRRYPNAENEIHFCVCGCGQRINFKPAYRSQGYPDRIHGHWTDESRQQQVEKLREYSGEKASNWKGGISKEPYAFSFSNALKESIRQRDSYKCQLCGVPEIECIIRLPIHHIDYDKKNSDPSNLIALCVSCNSRVNTNRPYWTKHFQRKMRRQRFFAAITWFSKPIMVEVKR